MLKSRVSLRGRSLFCFVVAAMAFNGAQGFAQAQPKPVSAKPRMQTTLRPTLKRTRYLNFPAYRLSDGRTEAIVVPALGRVMRYGLVGGKNLLWNAVPDPTKPGEWRNWGGDKSWPSPQSRWPLAIGHDWPPHPSWDGEPYKAKGRPKARLRITSGVWPGFECRVIREFGFDSNGDFIVTQTYEKRGGPPVELALWSITQVATPEAIFLPSNPQSAYKNGFYWLTKADAAAKVQPDVSAVAPNLLRVRPAGSSLNKIGVDALNPTLVTVSDGIAFRQRTARAQGNYPDGAQGSGFPLEVFDIGGSGRDHYMEAELLSPLRIFKAGSRWSQTVRWSLHSLNSSSSESSAFLNEIQALIALS